MHWLVEGTSVPASTKATTSSSVIARRSTAKVCSPIHTTIMIPIDETIATTDVPSWRIFQKMTGR